MKELIQIIILISIASCAPTKIATDSVADEKFELCSDIQYESLITELGPIEGKLIYKKNIHSLLENLLLRENYLTEVNKSGYLKLLDKAKRKEIKPDLLEKFKSELGFDPYILFPTSSFLSCYGYLFEQLNILDKTSWQYEFGLAFNKYEAYGNMNDNQYLKEAMKKIPDEKFKNIVYRKLFLDLIYMHLN